MLDELYFKVLQKVDPTNASCALIGLRPDSSNFSEEQEALFNEIGQEVIGGAFNGLAIRLLPQFVKVKDTSVPYVNLARTMDGQELHVCAKDSRGLLGLISGACYQVGLDITQVHAYTLPESGMIFDIFNLGESPRDFSSKDWLSSLSSVMKREKTIDADPSEILRNLDFKWSLDDCQYDNLLRLTFETSKHKQGYLFALSSGLYKAVDANIYAAKSSRENGDTFRVFFNSPITRIDKIHQALSGYFDKK